MKPCDSMSAEATTNVKNPEAAVTRLKDFGRKTDASKWTESLLSALTLAARFIRLFDPLYRMTHAFFCLYSDLGADQAAAADALNKHCHTGQLNAKKQR